MSVTDAGQKADQLYVIMRLVEQFPDVLEDWEIKSIAKICSGLSSDLVCWIEEKERKDKEKP